MNEERLARVKNYICELEKVMRFYPLDGYTGRSLATEGLLGVLAEIMTRVDDLGGLANALSEKIEILKKAVELQQEVIKELCARVKQ